MNLGKISRIAGGVVLGLVASGMVMNFKDIRRYARMSVM